VETTPKPCEQFGPTRAAEIEGLVEAATGAPCPGRTGGECPLAAPSCPVAALSKPDLRDVS